MQAEDPDIAATRSILLNWANLSEGDISILHATLRAEDSCAGTIEGTANSIMWENFERLGWASRVRPAILQPTASRRPVFFTLTDLGRDRVPAFLAHYDLRPGAYYTDKQRSPADPAAFDRALASLAEICPAASHPPGLTLEARMKLRFLEAQSVALALAAFAYDAKAAVAAMLAFHKDGRPEKSERELLALRTRIRMKWAFDHVGHPPPDRGLHDLASPLGIGLGQELEGWLNDNVLAFPQAYAWLAQYEADIDRFCDHVTARSAPASTG